jgi:hypothetical protein
LNKLVVWTHEHDNYKLALSNPKFEYWLLLHFEDGNNLETAQDCIDRLRRYLPNYDKDINKKNFTREKIKSAIFRGEKRLDNHCLNRLSNFGSTTVFKLVNQILKANTYGRVINF